MNRRSLQMQIRMNEAYAGYSSFANGHTKTERIQIIADCKTKLAAMGKPEKKAKTIKCYQVSVNGDFEGCIYNPIKEEAAIEAAELLGHNKFTLKAIYN